MKHEQDIGWVSAETVGQAAGSVGCALGVLQAETLAAHLRLVLKVNQHTNLTAIRLPDQAIRLHIADSLACCPEVESVPGGRIVDVGSGAGYPGIPVAVATGRQMTLCDSAGRKARFLETVVEELALGDRISVMAVRGETLALNEPASYSGMVARAVAPLRALVELASPLLAEGGVLICLKGLLDAAELDEAVRTGALCGMTSHSDRQFLLPGGGETRRVVCYRKLGDAAVKLPRRPGMAQKRPLW